MKQTTRLMLAAAFLVLGGVQANAQWGSLISQGVKAAKDAKKIVKKVKGDADFTYNNAVIGTFHGKTSVIEFKEKYTEGELAGQKISFTIQQDGNIVAADGSKVGVVYASGDISCRGQEPYLNVNANGQVTMDGDVVGTIADNGDVRLYGYELIGNAADIDKKAAAFIYFGILTDKDELLAKKAEIEKQRAAAAEARKQQASRQSSSSYSGSSSSGSSTGSNKPNYKSMSGAMLMIGGSGRGIVTNDGLVLDQGKNSLRGKMPRGDGNIENGYGSSIGKISGGALYKGSTKLGTFNSSGNELITSDGTKIIAESNGDVYKIISSNTRQRLGECRCGNARWAIALVFGEFF